MKENINLSADVSALGAYVDMIGSGEILEALAGSARTIKYITAQAGVNAPTNIHLMETTGAFGDGLSCELNDNTKFTFTDRVLTPAFVKQESVICDSEFQGKWLAYNSRYSANDQALSFEEVMMNSFQENVGKNLENWIWNGGTINSTNYDGLVDIIEADGTQVKAGSTADTYGMIESLVMAIPAEQFNETEIFVSPAVMRELKRDLLKNDFRLTDLDFTNGAGEVDAQTLKLPVYGTLIHAVDGLAGNTKAYAVVPAHTVYGYSVDGPNVNVKAIFDDITEKHILRAKLAIAVQIAFPAETFYAEKVD